MGGFISTPAGTVAWGNSQGKRYLARGVHFGRIPLGLVLEVDLKPLVIRLGLLQRQLNLQRRPRSFALIQSIEHEHIRGAHTGKPRHESSVAAWHGSGVHPNLGGVEGKELRHD